MAVEREWMTWEYLALDGNINYEIVAWHPTREGARMLGMARGCRHPIVVFGQNYLDAQKKKASQSVEKETDTTDHPCDCSIEVLTTHGCQCGGK